MQCKAVHVIAMQNYRFRPYPSDHKHARRQAQPSSAVVDVSPATRCRKVRYRDRVAALLALAGTRSTRHTRRPKAERSAYRCPTCKGWHLTSRTDPEETR